MDKQCKIEISELLVKAGVGRMNVEIVLDGIEASLLNFRLRHIEELKKKRALDAEAGVGEFFEIGGPHDIAHGT